MLGFAGGHEFCQPAGDAVTRVLQQIIVERGVPAAIRCDNGPEFTARHLAWCTERKIALVHIEPGRAPSVAAPQQADSQHANFV